MKTNSIKSLLATLAALLTLGACDTSSDSSYEPSRDCAITAVGLGSLKRVLHTTSSEGKDSTYTVAVTGSLYPMYIDQLENHIFNADSLPKGTDLSRVVFATFNVKNGAYIKSLYSGNDTIFSLKDSTDFTRPRVITAVSEDGLSRREYTLELRVHREEGETFAWQPVAEGAQLPAASFVESKAICLGQSLYVFGALANGETQVVTTSTLSPNFESAAALPLYNGVPVDVRSIVLKDNSFYALAGGQLVKASQALDAWTAPATALRFDALVSAHADSLYALSAGRLMASAQGTEWVECATDAPAQLPTSDIAAASLPTRTNQNLVSTLMVGLLNSQATVWRHDTDTEGAFSYPWMWLPQTEELDDLTCPALERACMAVYDDAFVLVGTPLGETAPKVYTSRDFGRTWKAGELEFPSLEGATAVTIAIDPQQYCWVVCSGTGRVLKGRINRLGWLRNAN